ncbi:site-specific integrase [Salisediminibacterium selenitireducens]|uniref:Integrase family protein n=1 Tax=Bacillus selenitireducens (strain ATCC 700615 / DSM 15326 / MLS10) TaxID=439292 RepID=D6XUH2_BACIE|nr:integrase family protein [[Bacillus] selenitireducens MLS10]
MNRKKQFADYVRLTDQEYDSLENRLGRHQTRLRIKRLNELKINGKRPLKFKSDFQALSAMTPRTVEPIRDKTQIEAMKSSLKQRSYRDYFLFVLGLNTGLRVGDLLPLKVGDVRGKKYIVLIEEKTTKAKRFPLNREIRSFLSDYTIGMSDDDYLFASSMTGEPIKRDRAYKILRRAAEEAGVEFVGTHTMRKTFGYHFYKQYKDASMLQKIFNHSSQSITLRYIGISQEEIDDAIDDFSL